jgi:predicted component of type VI protein secretion system
MEFDLSFGRAPHRRAESSPMRLLVLGDFSGKPAGERTALEGRPTPQIDIDTIGGLLMRLEPRVALPSGEIRIKQIDDFHPDRLYAGLDRFKAMRAARTAPPAGADEDVARLLGKAADPRAAPAAPAATGIEGMIRDIVAPHIVRDTSAQEQGHRAAVDAAIAGDMRAVLHDPQFQRLESAWRGVHWLITNLELDENLHVHLFDVTRDELVDDIVSAQGRMADTGLYRALVERARVPGGVGWSALIGLFSFGPSDADMGLLAALGLVASQAGGPLLADADAALVGGGANAGGGWPALRRSEAARWIALGAPRVLLRLPYGQGSDPIEAFTFEEFAGPPVHDEFLWGHASLAMALLIGRAFTARGWEMEPGDERDIGDLPAYTYIKDGERVLQPCAERLLNEREIDAFVQSGLVAIASRRDRNAVTAVRFQSVSDPPAALAW